MNEIHRFVSRPLWVVLLVVLLRKPLGRVDIRDEYAEWSKMLTDLTSSIRWVSENPMERWLLNKILDWVDTERRAMDELYNQGAVVVEGGKK